MWLGGSYDKVAAMNEYRLFRKNKRGRQWWEDALYVRAQWDCNSSAVEWMMSQLRDYGSG